LRRRGITPDFRALLYTIYHELWRAIAALREIIDSGEHLRLTAGRDLVA